MTRRRGFVLPIVLVLIGLLAVVMGGFIFFVKAEVNGARAERDAQQARLTAESGLQEVITVLRKSRDDPGQWFDVPDRFRHALVWAESYKRDEDPVKKMGSRAEILRSANPAPAWRYSVVAQNLDGLAGTMRYGVTPENSKLNLNTATETEIERLLLDVLPELGVQNASDLVAALLDWLDVDEDMRPGGAETEYYQTLTPGYKAKNGPLDSIEELLLVKGFTAAILYGEDTNRNGILDPNEDDGDKSFPYYDNADNRLAYGLAPYITVWSRDKLDLQGTGGTSGGGTSGGGTTGGGTSGGGKTGGGTSGGGKTGGGTSGGGKTGGGTSGGGTSGGGTSGGGKSGGGTQGGAKPGTKTPSGGDKSGGGQTPETSGKKDKLKTRQAAPDPGKKDKVTAGGSDDTKTPKGDQTTGGSSDGTESAGGDTGGDLTGTGGDLTGTGGLGGGGTTSSETKINVNTAPIRVLRALDDMTPEAAERIVALRQEQEADTLKSLDWLVNSGAMDSETFAAVKDKLTTQSLQFHVEIVAYADHNKLTRRDEWIIEMRGPLAQVLYHRDLTSLGFAWPVDDDTVVVSHK